MLFLLILVPMCSRACATDTLSAVCNDSLLTEQDSIIPSKLQTKMDNIGQKRLFQATYLGLPMISSDAYETVLCRSLTID